MPIDVGMSDDKHSLLIEQFRKLSECDSDEQEILYEKEILKLVLTINAHEVQVDQFLTSVQKILSNFSQAKRDLFFKILVWAQMDKPLKNTFAEAHLLKSKNKRQLDSRLKRLNRLVFLVNELALIDSADVHWTNPKKGWNAVGYKFHDAIEADAHLMQMFFDHSLPSKKIYRAYCGRGRPKWYSYQSHQKMKTLFNLRKSSEELDFIKYVLPLLPEEPDIKSPKLTKYPDPIVLLAKLRKVITLSRLADI